MAMAAPMLMATTMWRLRPRDFNAGSFVGRFQSLRPRPARTAWKQEEDEEQSRSFRHRASPPAAAAVIRFPAHYFIMAIFGHQ